MPIILLLFIVYSLILISIDASSIIFPFKTVSKIGNITSKDINYNISHFATEHYSLPAYTEIKIGSPPQNVKFILTNDDCGFKIGKARKCLYNSDYLSYYNRNKSSNFKYTDKYTKKNSEFENGHSCSDNFEFVTEISDLNKKVVFRDIEFYLGTDTNEDICGVIGLELNQYKLYCDSMNNIFESLKNNKIIQKQNWIIKYTSKYEGIFIISPDLSQIINNYDENKLIVTNT